ncbi:MAG: ABC transporter transmembrane domain-containing protein [Proteobacteria bacterium]|nr:ABC transporter transmembrane domain-containing protein [Pseudomonadota bacterium]
MAKSKISNSDFKRLYRMALVEWRILLLGMGFLALSSAALLAFPQVIKSIVDNALASRDASTLNQVALLAMGIFAVQSLAGAARYYCFTLAGERIVVRLRKQLFTHLLDQDIAFFDGQKTGELQSRLSSDATILQNALSVNISMLVRTAATAVGGLIMLIYTSPQLAFSLLLSLPIAGAGVAAFGGKIRTLAKLQQDAFARSGGVANESLSGVRIVRAFGQDGIEINRYEKTLNESLNIAKKKILTIGSFIALASILGSMAIIGVLWYGSTQVVNGEFTIGALTSFMLYTMTVAVSVGTLGGLWTDFMSAAGASKRIFEILDRPKGITKNGATKVKNALGRIQLDNVSFEYMTREHFSVLSHVNIVIEPGEIVALVGPSGSGKSTIAALIARFYDPTEGKILIDDINLKDLDYETFHSLIGMVPQDPVLFSVSIAENIRFGLPSASLQQIKDAASLSNAAQFIDAFPEGYDTLVGERGVQLSGGQRQRIAIARAAVRNPKILILDEATSALDSESESIVQEALERLMVGRTTLIIAHRLSTVKIADRILVLDGGKIVEVGSHNELMANENSLYKKLINKQRSDLT